MTHVRTSPYYPQSNGKIERWHKSLKGECIRPGTPGWETAGDPRRARPEVGSGSQTAAYSSAAGCLKFSSRSLGVVLLAIGPSNGTSPRGCGVSTSGLA